MACGSISQGYKTYYSASAQYYSSRPGGKTSLQLKTSSDVDVGSCDKTYIVLSCSTPGRGRSSTIVDLLACLLAIVSDTIMISWYELDRLPCISSRLLLTLHRLSGRKQDQQNHKADSNMNSWHHVSDQLHCSRGCKIIHWRKRLPTLESAGL